MGGREVGYFFNWGILGRGEGVYRKGFRSRAGIDIALDQRGPSEGNLQRTLQVLEKAPQGLAQANGSLTLMGFREKLFYCLNYSLVWFWFLTYPDWKTTPLQVFFCFLNGMFPVMENRCRKNGIRFSIHQGIAKVFKCSRPSRSNDRDA